MPRGIFISYRRKDTEAVGSRLADELRESIENVQIFRDVEAIAPGEDFAVALNHALAECSVMLVLIGPQWLDVRDAHGRRRIDVATDWTRQEIATALARNVRVVPVLTGDASLPDPDDLPEDLRPITRRQAIELDNNRWHSDCARLIDALVQAEGFRRRKPQSDTGASRRAGMLVGGAMGAMIVGIIAVGAVVILLIIGYVASQSSSGGHDRTSSTDARAQGSGATPVDSPPPRYDAKQSEQPKEAQVRTPAGSTPADSAAVNTPRRPPHKRRTRRRAAREVRHDRVCRTCRACGARTAVKATPSNRTIGMWQSRSSSAANVWAEAVAPSRATSCG
jgi:hypothetical protein